MNFSLEQLSAFVAAAECGSFSAAARKLGKVQSVISTLIANLELDLNVMLFSREGRTPTLTHEGKALLPRAKTILTQCDHLSASASSFMLGTEPNLCIAMESLAVPLELAQIVEKIDAQFPYINLEILFSTASDIPDLIRSGRAQLGVMMQFQDPPEGLDFKLLGSFEYWCVAKPTHPLAKNNEISFDELPLHRQIIVSPRNSNEKQEWKIANQVWATDNPVLALDMTVAGLGWAMLPSSFVKLALKKQQLVRLDLDFDTNSWNAPIDLVWSSKIGRGPVSLAIEKILHTSLSKPL